jgi:enoyl-CoA hydratase
MSNLKLSIAKDGIAVVTLANPPINAMDAALLEEMSNLFEGLAADRAIRAAVIAADGPAFSAGLDLKTTPGLDRLGQRRLVDALNASFGTLYAWPKPLVAAVNGHAIAGGLILALCADWRVVADVPMQITLAEVRVGVTYPVAPLAIARAELAPSTARRLILLGETVDAAAAERLAIADERVPAEALLARAVAQAERHAGLPPQAFAITKRELRAVELERIAAARAGQGEPRLAAWLGDEMRRASSAVLRGAA